MQEKKYTLLYTAHQIHPDADVGAGKSAIFDNVNEAIEYIERETTADAVNYPWCLDVAFTIMVRVAEKNKYEAVQVRQADNRLTGNRRQYDDRQSALDFCNEMASINDPNKPLTCYWTVHTITTPAGEWEVKQ